MSLRKMKDIEGLKIDVIDGATASFLKDLDRTLGRMNTRVQGFIGDLEAGERLATSARNLARATNAQAQLEEMLLEAGYREDTQKLIAAYDRVAALSRAGLSAGGIDEPFSELEARVLTSLKDVDLSRWQILGDELTNQIQASMLDAVVSGSTVRELQDAIEAQLRGIDGNDPAILGRSKTLANTLTHSFDRTVTNRKAQAAGIDTFIYLGPDDSITRPFCAAVLHGEGDAEFGIPAVDGDPPIYEADEISQMDNGTGLPVFQYGGGYNCRHKFRPIAAKVAQEVLSA